VKGIDIEKVLQVTILEARPNPLFEEWQRELVRFLRFNRAVPCAECGRRSKHHWTQVVSFKAYNVATAKSFILERNWSGKIHPPLAPVCGSHPLAVAEFPEIPRPKRRRKPKP
jgi:hypothetical protein